MRNVLKRTTLNRINLQRNTLMVLGILAFAPPLGLIAQLFGGTMLCGELCGRMAIGLNLPRELLSRSAGVIFLGLWLTITVFFGRWMCSHVCPVGALTEFGSRLIPARLRLDTCKWLDAPLFRYGFLAAYILLPAIGLASICCAYCSWSTIPETFGAIFVPRLRPALFTGAKLASIGLYAGLLGVFTRDGRGHCHLVCPVGALDSLVSALSARLPFARRVRVSPSRCSGCGLCEQACPSHAIRVHTAEDALSSAKSKTATIDYHRCYHCRRCESACARQALHIGRPERTISKETQVASTQ